MSQSDLRPLVEPAVRPNWSGLWADALPWLETARHHATNPNVAPSSDFARLTRAVAEFCRLFTNVDPRSLTTFSNKLTQFHRSDWKKFGSKVRHCDLLDALTEATDTLSQLNEAQKWDMIQRASENLALQRAAEQSRDLAVPVAAVAAAGMLSAKALAEKHGIKKAEALRRRLERWRLDHDSGYVEVQNGKPQEPKYLYDPAAVQDVLNSMKAGQSA